MGDLEASRLVWQRQQVERQLLETYEEQGREELLKGNPLFASVYLSEAYKKGAKRTSLRFLLAESLRALDAQLVTIEAHSEEVFSARYSPDGTLLVTASHDRTGKIWDAASRKPIGLLQGHKESVNSASFSPDGKYPALPSAMRLSR